MMDPARFQLWRLISPALPVGAYAYSQGLESAVEMQWVRDEATALEWITGLLLHNVACTDAPVLIRCHHAWRAGDLPSIQHWNATLLALREASELRLENQQLGKALARVLAESGIRQARAWLEDEAPCHATMFALASFSWGIDTEEAVAAYLWSWCENQVAAAIKLIPLGQTSGQRVLTGLIEELPGAVSNAMGLPDEDIGMLTPGLAMASALHETQYSRLFRS